MVLFTFLLIGAFLYFAIQYHKAKKINSTVLIFVIIGLAIVFFAIISNFAEETSQETSDLIYSITRNNEQGASPSGGIKFNK